MFNLNHESATNLIPILRPLVSPNNTVTAFPNNNSLIITDYAANLNRLSRIIAALDNPRAGSDVEIVQVKNAVAIDIAMAVSRLLDDSARGGQPGGRPGQRTDLHRAGVAGRRGQPVLRVPGRPGARARPGSARARGAARGRPRAVQHHPRPAGARGGLQLAGALRRRPDRCAARAGGAGHRGRRGRGAGPAAVRQPRAAHPRHRRAGDRRAAPRDPARGLTCGR
ncbi:MAG TPA: secretin N-terminal domain-containing protein [Myxococcota bacterium]|nr:secretin N-terminal domain-containing protein [Myxococcota bacterium]